MSILLLAPLAVRSGYGSLARGIASALAELRPGIAVHDLADFPGGRLRNGWSARSDDAAPPGPGDPWLRIDVPWRREFPRPLTAASYLYTMFEAGPLPEAWLTALRSHDGIIVPSTYCAELFAAAGCPPVAVVPPGADPRFSPEAPPLRLAARAVVFLFVGEYNHRKGIDIAVRAYARAFTLADDVTLVVKTWSSRIRPEDIEQSVREEMRRVSASPPHVLFMHGMLPDSLLPSLYTAASALVMPSRAEAFGLPAAEAQACGVPVIASRSTGLSETLHPESAYIVGISGMRPARPDGLPWDFYEGRLMPEPDEDHIVDMMREIRQHPEVAKSKGLAASRMQHRRPWRQAGLELLELLERPRVSGAGE